MPGAARWLTLFAIAAAGCSRPSPPFSVPNARAHLQYIAGDVGPRPAGSEASRRARAYITDQLQRAGFQTRVQDTDAERPEFGLTARVRNIIGYRAGTRAEAIGLVAHYDSVLTAPGASDDALGVAVCLEAARVLASRAAARWSVFVLLTDAEEEGLLGAAGLLEDREVRLRLKAYINLDSTGSALPLFLFQAGPGNGWLIDAWAAHAPSPRGASYLAEVYKRLPNDTDFSIFEAAGIPGLNFAAVGDSYRYHLPLDTPDRIDDRLLRAAGDTVVATATALDEHDITRTTTGASAFFDVAGWTGVRWTQRTAHVVDLASLVAGLAAAVAASRRLVRHAGWRRLLAAWSIALLCSTLAVMAMVGASALLRDVREVYHPWYAHPIRFFVLLALGAVTGMWLGARTVFRFWPASDEPVSGALAVWAVALVVWLVGAGALAWTAPLAAYLLTLPLLCAAVLVTASGTNGTRLAIASALVSVVCFTLWVPAIAPLVLFLVTLLGSLPLITPVWVFPAIFSAAAIVLVPACVATLRAAGASRRPYFTRALLLSLGLSFAWAYMAEAYSRSRPLRRTVQFHADASSGQAVWQIESVEPGLDLGAGAPPGWRPGPAPDRHTLAPFVFHALGRVGDAPVTAEFTSRLEADALVVAVHARPLRDASMLRLVLPEGVVPLRSSRPGLVRGGHWTSLYAAAPHDGVTWQLQLPAGSGPMLTELRVGIRTWLPGGTERTLPAWLPVDHSQWESRAWYTIAPSPAAAPAGGTIAAAQALR